MLYRRKLHDGDGCSTFIGFVLIMLAWVVKLLLGWGLGAFGYTFTDQ